VKIWTAIRRLNAGYDEWQARAAARFIGKLDHPGDAGSKPPARRHISVWDLLSTNRQSGTKEAGE
jgi:hypothetical protein